MAKARAARRRAPLPWRSGMESRIIEQLVWQWWVDKNSGQWPAFAKATARHASGEGKEQQIPRRDAPRNDSVLGQDGGQRNHRVSQNEALHYQGEQQIIALRATGRVNPAPTKAKDGSGGTAGRPWAKYRVARLLGVSHTWVNKLVRRFEADPERMRRKMRAFAPATFEKLERAREETRRERELGWLRGPIRWRRVKVTLEGRKKKVVAATQAEMKRRGTLRQASFGSARHGGQAQDRPFDFAQGQPCGLSDRQALREGRYETQRDSASRAGRVNPAPTKASAAPVRYSELPQWARGLLLPGDPGKTKWRGPGARHGEQAAGKPRPVPFAFRRRR